VKTRFPYLKRTAAVTLVGLAALLLAPGASARTGPITTFAPQTSGGFDYGIVPDGGHRDQTFTLTNSGGTATGALIVSLTGSSAYSKVGDTCTAASIGPGKRCGITIRYAPTGKSTDTAALTATSTKPAARATIALTGTGGYVDVEFSPASHDFGAASGSQTFTATNQGNIATGGYTFAGPTDEHFGITGTNTCDGSAIAAGGSCSFTIAFTAPGGCGALATLYLDTASLGSYASVTFQGIQPQCQHLYWANAGDQGHGTTIGRAVQTGSDVQNSFITGANEPIGVAVDKSHVYWTNFGLQGDGSGVTVGRSDLNGQNVNQSFITGATNPAGLAVDGNYIYWANDEDPGSIGRAALDGSNVDQNFITGINQPIGLAVDGDHIYWSYGNSGVGTIARADLDGENVDLNFMTAASPVFGLAVDANHIYFTEQLAGSIGRADLNGQNLQDDFITGADVPGGVAVDANFIYWSNGGDINAEGTTIGRATLAGGSVNQSFITGADGPADLAIGP